MLIHLIPYDLRFGGGTSSLPPPIDTGRGFGQPPTPGGYGAQMGGGQPYGGYSDARGGPVPPSYGGGGAPMKLDTTSGYDARMGGGQPSSGGGFMDRAPPLQQAGAQTPPTRTLIIRNLPVDYTWQMVKERLTRMGEVDFCDILQSGVARVSFRNVATAERVNAALQGSIVEGRQIGVTYD